MPPPQPDSEWPDPTKYLFISMEQKRKDQTKPYDGKKMFWIPDEKECYVLASLVSEKGDVCTLELGREGGGEKVSLIHCSSMSPSSPSQ